VAGGAAANHWLDPPAPRLAGDRLKPALLGRERAAAAAIARGVGILEHESLAHQRLFVLERRAIQVQQAFRVNEDARAVFLEILSRSRALVSRRMAYDRPEQPPPCTPTRRPPCSGDTPSFFEQGADLLRGALGQVIFAMFGLSVSVAISKTPSRRL